MVLTQLMSNEAVRRLTSNQLMLQKLFIIIITSILIN